MSHSLFRTFSFALAAALLIGLLAVAAFAEDGANFSLRPGTHNTNQTASQAYFVLDLQPGAILQTEFVVTNNGSEAGVVHLYPVDATTGQTSGTVFRMREDPLQGVGGWLTLGTTELSLAAGESKTVPLTLVVPADVGVGEHVGGLVAEGKTLEGENTEAYLDNAANFIVQIQNRMAMAVQVNVPGPVVKRVDLLGITVGGTQGYQKLFLHLYNRSNVMLKPRGTLVVKDDKGQIVQNLSFQLSTFLPDTEIDYPLFVEEQALAAGDYQGELELQYGDETVAQQQVSFSITTHEIAEIFEGREPLSAPAVASAAAHSIRWPFWNLIYTALGLLLFIAIGFALIHRHKNYSGGIAMRQQMSVKTADNRTDATDD